MEAHNIALAFNTHSDKKTWSARASTKADGSGYVHFNSTTGMIALTYNPTDGTFAVKFTKLHAAWGDYIAAIARSLYVVLNTLKAAGLPFDAPPSPEGIEIIATKGAANVVYVRYSPPPAPFNPVMPELRQNEWDDAVRNADTFALPDLPHAGGMPPAFYEAERAAAAELRFAEKRGEETQHPDD